MHREETPPDSEFVIHLKDNGDGSFECWYYFVNHPTRVLFWLEAFAPDVMLCNLLAVNQWSHISECLAGFGGSHLSSFSPS